MGSQYSIVNSQPLPQSFKQLQQLPSIYINSLDGTRLQKHIVTIQSQQQIQHERQIFIFRKLNQHRIVPACYFQQQKPSQLCGSIYRLSYFTQLQHRSFTKTEMSVKQGLNFLVQSLEGFQILYQKFGGFQVHQGQFYPYLANKVRVWISSNPSQTLINQCCQHSKIREQQMIEQIFKIFNHCVNSPCYYTDHLRTFQCHSRNIVCFNNIIEYMKETQQKITNMRDLPSLLLNDTVSSAKKIKVNLKKTEEIEKKICQQLQKRKITVQKSYPFSHRRNFRCQRLHTKCPSKDGFSQINQTNSIINSPFTTQLPSSANSYLPLDALQKYSNIKQNQFKVDTQQKSIKKECSKQTMQISFKEENKQLNELKDLRMYGQQLMKAAITVKSIIHPSELKIDSDLLADIQNISFEKGTSNF